MSQIKIKNLSFSYNSQNVIFDNLSLEFDSNWKLGLIGRNGKGKTTLLKLLSGELKGKGNIDMSVKFQYFPTKIENINSSIQGLIENQFINIESWKIYKELNLINFNMQNLFTCYKNLSGGEQVKFQLAIMFAQDETFQLLDEPTNNLDQATKNKIVEYLQNKKGFIIVSHDRWLLDNCIDHVISINKNSIDLQKGNFSSWDENFNRKLNEEIIKNQSLQKDIDRLELAKIKTKQWANKSEKQKSAKVNDSAIIDKGFIGARAARLQKHSKIIENRIENAIEEKRSLLNDFEKEKFIKICPNYFDNDELLIEGKNINYFIKERKILNNVNFILRGGDRLFIQGENGSGKTSLIKIIMSKINDYSGYLYIKNKLKLSYVSQDLSMLKGKLDDYINEKKFDKSLFLTLLSKLGVENKDFYNNIECMSDGQKKKILLCSSLIEKADVYIWDEPLNFVDIVSRKQIENLIKKYKPTMIVIEHDKFFLDNIATSVLHLS